MRDQICKDSYQHPQNFTWFVVVKAPLKSLGAISAINIGTFNHPKTEVLNPERNVFEPCRINHLEKHTT